MEELLTSKYTSLIPDPVKLTVVPSPSTSLSNCGFVASTLTVAPTGFSFGVTESMTASLTSTNSSTVSG